MKGCQSIRACHKLKCLSTIHMKNGQALKIRPTLLRAYTNWSWGEHTGTHVDAINHMAKEYAGKSIDTMPLSMFHTEGICLDFRHKGLRQLIGITDIELALKASDHKIKKKDTILFCTDHYSNHFGH